MSHKPQALLLRGSLVTIVKHRRQVGSEFATFIDIFWREDKPCVVLHLPSGHRTVIPASWTDLPVEGFAQTRDRAEILPSALLELARYFQGLPGGRTKTRRRKNREPKPR